MDLAGSLNVTDGNCGETRRCGRTRDRRKAHVIEKHQRRWNDHVGAAGRRSDSEDGGRQRPVRRLERRRGGLRLRGSPGGSAQCGEE